MSATGLALRMLLCTLLLTTAATAQARIDPLKRCTMTLSPALIDYGQLVPLQATTLPLGLARRPGLTRPAGMALPTRTLFLNLVCPQPINLTMLFHAHSRDPYQFDFGGAGGYTLRVHDVRVDELPADIGLVAVPGEPPSRIAEVMEWSPEHAWVPVRVGRQISGSRLSAQIDVQTWLTADLGAVRDAQVWETQGLVNAEDAREFAALDLRAEAMPRSCTPRLTPATLELGTVPRSSLDPEAATALARRSVQLQLNCNGPTLLALKLLDNRAGGGAAAGWAAAVPGPARFALGTGGGGIAGVYALSMGAVIADGQALQVLRGNGERASTWSAYEEGAPLQRFDAQSAVYAFAMPGHVMPAAVDNLGATLHVDVQLAPTTALGAGEEVLLDGAVTIEMVYL